MQAQMPIFSRSYDLLVWLLQATRHFPKMHRHDFKPQQNPYIAVLTDDETPIQYQSQCLTCFV